MPIHDSPLAGRPCWIDLFTTDPDRSRAFYGDLFGWTSEDTGPEFGHYINFARDGVMVAGGMTNDGTSGVPDVWSVYLKVDDAQATVDAATAQGGSTIVPPMPVGELGIMAQIADPGGAAVGIWQPKEFAGFGVSEEPGSPAWFELHTRDYDAVVAFYRTVFGWDAHVMSDEPTFRYTTLGAGPGQVAGVMAAEAFLPEGVPAHWSVYFRVDDADATVARATELGGSVVVPPEDTPYGRIAQLADPTGARFKLQAR